VLQSAGADAIGALLVFLELLERQAEGVRDIALAHIKHETPHSHAAAAVLSRLRYQLGEGRRVPFHGSTLAGQESGGAQSRD
jgi:hypothetical protein